MYLFPQSRSSEVILEDVAAIKPSLKSKEQSKKYCLKSIAVGMKGCVKVATENAATIRDNIVLYKLAGKHSVALSLTPSKY